MFSSNNTFHSLKLNDEIEISEKFTYPFNYTPQPWVIKAAEEVKSYLKSQTEFTYEFGYDSESVGKMFGVLIVEDSKGRRGYLAAFSGKINETNKLPGFVPPIFDVLNPKGFFKLGENELNTLNQKILDLETSSHYSELKLKFQSCLQQQKASLNHLKNIHKKAKKQRDLLREEAKATKSPEEQQVLSNTLIQESKKNHFEFKDTKRNWLEKTKKAEADISTFERQIECLKRQRKQKSAVLQNQIHEAYQFLNANGEIKDLLSVFASFERMPPAGAGECAAPRLFQYAYKNNLKPLAMGEFWWGKSPSAEVRKQGEFYPACKSKCEPILSYMLQGLEVEENPVFEKVNYDLDIVYEDDYFLIVNKPAGVLSVPGKKIKECLQQKVTEYLSPEISPILVHRLDMATSGLVMIAKSLEVYKVLQKQFVERKVKKTYTAILDGSLNENRGKVELPLRVDLDNRPMQLVCEDHGKDAITYFQVINKNDLGIRILFFPITGRTHQLRVHAAHQNGLNSPILGDDLYGKSADRLYLHATSLEFNHPITLEKLNIKSVPPF